MFKNIIRVIFLLALVCLFPYQTIANVPDGTPKGEESKPESSGNDGKDGVNSENQKTCKGCGNPFNPLSPDSNTNGSGSAEAGCISMNFHFGHLVHNRSIPAGTIKLLSDAPSPKIFSPQGLYFDFNLESYATHKDNKFTVTRPNGFKVVYDANGQPTERQSSFRSFLSFSAVMTTASVSDGAVAVKPVYTHPTYFYRIFGNGSKAYYELYAGHNSETAYYRLKKLYTTDGAELTPSHKDIGIEVIYDNNKCLRQIRSQADGLADMVITGEFSYEIRMYAPSAINSKTTENGVSIYSIKSGATPYIVWRIENPQQSNSLIDKVKITRIINDKSFVYQWIYNSYNDRWSLIVGNGLEQKISSKQKTEYKDAKENETSLEIIKDIKNNEQSIVSRTLEKYTRFSFGDMLTETILDPEGSAQKTITEYYPSSNIKNQKSSNGRWEFYSYDNNKRTLIYNTPFKNTNYTEGVVGVQSFEYGYVDSASDDRPRSITRKVNGTIVGKTFNTYSTSGNRRTETIEVATMPSAQAGNASNLKTTKVYDIQTDRLISVTHPDGKSETYTYEYGNYTPQNNAPGLFEANPSGNALCETIVYGTTSQPSGIAGKTTKKITIKDEYGNKVLEEVYSLLNSGYERISYTVYTYDVMHKLLRSYSSNKLERTQNWYGTQLVDSTAQNGTELLYSYDSADRLKSVTKKGTGNSVDVVTSYTYDAADRKLSETISSNGLILTKRWTYDALGRVSSFTDADGLTTTYEYVPATASRGEIVKKILPGDFTTITESYFDGQVKSVTGTAQVPVFYDYGVDAATNCSWVKKSYGSENSAQWEKTYTDMAGNISKVEKSGFNGQIVVEQNFYNAAGQLIKTSKTGEASKLFVYDELGNLYRFGLDVDNSGALELASSDRIQEKSYGYTKDSTGVFFVQSSLVYGIKNSSSSKTIETEKTQLTNLPNGVNSLKYTTDRFGNVTETKVSINRSGKTVTTEVLSPDSTVPAQTVAVNELKTSERSKTNLTTTYTYDALGRLTGVTDPRTGTSTVSYYTSGVGKIGKRYMVTNAAGNTTTYDYDSSTGRKISERNALGKYSRFAYNSYGQVTKVWGESEYPLEFAYDLMGRKVTQTTYRNATVSFAGTTFPTVAGDVTTWTYDESSGLVTSKKDANNKSVTYTYSADGKLLTRTWSRGITTTYSYDTATGELLKADYSDATQDIERTYNRMGNLVSVSDAAGVRTFNYDDNFNLTGETLGARTHNYTYSTSGIKGRYIGLTGNHTYSYDQYGRISQINNITYTRLANSELITQVNRPNGINSVYGYETSRDIESGVNHGTFASYGYTNNEIGNRTSMSRSGSVFSASDIINYSYNERSEVTGALSNAANTTYNYTFAFDPIGNRLNATLAGQSVSYTTNILNQYTAVNATAPTYDDDGNMLTNGNWSYTWNGENRLIRAVNSATGVKLEFGYDYMGRRIFKKVYSGEILEKHLSFVYDGYKLIEERNALDSNVAVRKYVWQPEILDRDVPLTVYDVASDKTYYYHTDANKNVTELSDESGNVVAHYEYSPFGSLTKVTGDYAESNPFRFSSEYFDAETGLVYYNYRYYNPELGRWISRDPIEEQGGCNLYIMLSNCPWDSWDSLGQLSWLDRAINVAANFAAGMGDHISGGWTDVVRERLGINDGVDKSSGAYATGKGAGVAYDVALMATGAGAIGKQLAKQGIKQTAKQVAKQAVAGTVQSLAVDQTIQHAGLCSNCLQKLGYQAALGVGVSPAGDGNLPEFRGGAYKDMSKPVGDGLDAHHMPADAATDILREDGPAIQMLPEDHQKTKSYGNKQYTDQLRVKAEKDFRGAMAQEIRDVRRVARNAGDPRRYNKAMMQMLNYAKATTKKLAK